MDQERKEPVVLRDEDITVPDDLVLTVVIFHGLIIMGELVEQSFGNSVILKKPRILTMLAQGKQINLSPLPGTPKQLDIKGEAFLSYTLPRQPSLLIYHLYCKVTDSRVDPGYE